MPRSRRRKGVPKPRPKAKIEKSFNVERKRYYDPGANPRPANPLPREARRQRRNQSRG